MLDESDARRLWQQLFRGQQITSLTLNEADSLLKQMHPESPLRLRLAAELEEIRDLHPSQLPKGKSYRPSHTQIDLLNE